MVFTARIIKVFYQNFARKKMNETGLFQPSVVIEMITRNYRFTI
jgi:hypothetical protein